MCRQRSQLAEVVLYQTAKPPARVEEQWLEGIFVGVRGYSDQLYILNERGLFVVLSVKRSARPCDRLVRSDPHTVLHRNARGWSSATRGGWVRKRLSIKKSDLATHGLH